MRGCEVSGAEVEDQLLSNISVWIQSSVQEVNYMVILGILKKFFGGRDKEVQ